MKNSDCKIPPFSLVYNMYISGLYGASYFVFIAKNAIYCLWVYDLQYLYFGESKFFADTMQIPVAATKNSPSSY